MKHLRPIEPRPRVAFVDPCSAVGYDLDSFRSGGLGGTEATVLRIATAIAPYFDVTQYQQNRTNYDRSEAGELRALKDVFDQPPPSAFVVINRWKVAVKLRRLHPDVPVFLWLHVYPGRHNRKMGAALREAGIEVICVSQAHADAVAEFVKPDRLSGLRVIYNAIADDLRPDDTPRDANRLLFASSPHKGLRQVFQQFATLRRTLPDLRLAVADPGYLSWETGPVPDGVIFLGALSHAALLRQMRKSLCLFYPQTTFAETFGLVLAEANAVGTPALVQQGLGANDEILSNATQLVNGNDAAKVLSRVTQWQVALPDVSANPAFRLSRVAREWEQMLKRAAYRHSQTQSEMV